MSSDHSTSQAPSTPAPPRSGNESFADRARARQAELTKPPGSLGLLETVAVRLAGLQRTERPRSRPAAALLFASDHPVCAHGVSAYPASVTGAMMSNFASGGAASTVFAAHLVGIQSLFQLQDNGLIVAFDAVR